MIIKSLIIIFNYKEVKRSCCYLLILFSSILFQSSLFAQNIEYARTVINTLTSFELAGRGAVDNGEKKAANYIANEFQKQGLKTFENSFFQEFNYPINTFPGELNVAFDNVDLVAGKDYLVDASSGKINGTFQLVWYNQENIPSKKQLKKLASRNFFDNKFIVIDDEDVPKENESFQLLKLNIYNAAGVIFIENKKLTKHLSSTYNDFAILRVKSESISRDYKSITITIDQKFINNYQSQNVLGYIKGSEYPDSFIVFSAHYDHLGKMGKDVYFPGANDNASGVAMLLNLSAHYSKKPQPKKTMVFIAFGAEEAGIIGSKYFVDNPLFGLNKINFVFNMDLMGTGSEGAMIVNGKVYKKQYNKLDDINKQNNYLPIIKSRGKAANSDHYWFSEKGVPSFFMYTMGGIQAYHDVYDVAKTLPLTKFEDCFRLIRDFVDEL